MSAVRVGQAHSRTLTYKSLQLLFYVNQSIINDRSLRYMSNAATYAVSLLYTCNATTIALLID